VTVDPTTASRVAAAGQIIFSNPASNDPYVIEIQDGGLTIGTSYTRTIATATGGFFDNATGPLPAGTPFTQGSDFVLTSPTFTSFSGVSLAVDGTGQGLVLTFTPVPEPATVLLACVAAGGLGAGWRRLRRKA
jgi:hypothetical protein